jgi:hypothetical protein
MKTSENTTDKSPTVRPEDALRNEERLDDALKTAIQNALVDQDIPVETGVRPNKGRREER